MRTLLYRCMLLAVAAGTTSISAPAHAQNPFEAAGEPAAESPFAPGEPAENPFGPAGGDEPAPEPEPRPAAAEGEPDAEAAPSVPNDPAVQAVLESNPQTPFELLRAIRILTDLGYPKLAQPLVDQLTQKQLSAEEQATLFRQFQPATLMRVARNPVLAAKLGPFIDQLFQAADAMRRDPQRLAQWTQLLADPSEMVRAQATLALVRARSGRGAAGGGARRSGASRRAHFGQANPGAAG